MAESPRPPASVTDSGLAQRNARVQQAAQAREAVRRAVEAHNAVVAAQRVGDHLPRLRELIDEHEVRKRHLYAMEQEIRSLLGDLYKDPAAAWQTLRSDLLSADATGYLDGNRHIAAQTAVRPLIPTLLAQTAMTRYGARIPNPCAVNAAYRRAQEEDTCVPYTDGPLQARAGRDMIQGHYSGYQRYKIDPRLVRPRGKDDQGSSHAEDALYTAMQTYLEARKRKLYWDKSRRGNPDSGGMTTTADLWNELHAHAPECLSAPMATTAANIAARPDMFDISPDCSHRTWSDGALQGALINHLQLGGVDQSVWLINNAAYETQVVHGGREGALAHVAQARDLVDQADPAAMRESGLPGLADDLDAYRSILDTIEADTGAEQNVDLPD
jgi:hypothetical protein